MIEIAITEKNWKGETETTTEKFHMAVTAAEYFALCDTKQLDVDAHTAYCNGVRLSRDNAFWRSKPGLQGEHHRDKPGGF